MILTNVIAKREPTMSDSYFAVLFATMFAGMIPAMNIVNIITEEKKNNTLRVLVMSNVSAVEYLTGVATVVMMLCEVCITAIALAGGFAGIELIRFIGVISVGIIISMIFGGAIGILCDNQMSGSSIVISFSLIFSFLPMLSNFNEDIKELAKYIYTQQINDLITCLPDLDVGSETGIIIALNFIVFLFFFMIMFKKKGLY